MRPESREETQLLMVDDLIHKAFRGSAEKLLMRILSAHPVRPERTGEMQKLIDEAKQPRKGKGEEQ